MSDTNGERENEKLKCPNCGKEHDYVDTIRAGSGDYKGCSKELTRQTLLVKYGFKDAQLHPFATYWTWGRVKKSGKIVKKAIPHPQNIQARYKHAAAQAHHLICSESMQDPDKNTTSEWAPFCEIFGYDINHPNNNVFLPACPQVACQLGIPLHLGGHAATYAVMLEKADTYYNNNSAFDGEMIVAKLQVNGYINYVEAVIKLIKPILNQFKKKKCEKYKKDPCESLDNKSDKIWKHVKKFEWTLTFDGLNYMPGTPSVAEIRALKTAGEALNKASRIKLFGQTPSIGCMHGRNIEVKKVHFGEIEDYYCERCDHGYSKAKSKINDCFKERETRKKRFTEKESFPVEADETTKKGKKDSYNPPSNWNSWRS